jgi:hypothetical protein
MPIGSTQGLWSIPGLGGLLTLVVVVILARVGGRLLGVRLGWGRVLLAGWLGLIVGIITVWAVDGRRAHGPRDLSWLPVLFAALIATMLIAVLMELLAKPRRSPQWRIDSGTARSRIHGERCGNDSAEPGVMSSLAASPHVMGSRRTCPAGAQRERKLGRSRATSVKRSKRRAACL